MLLPSLPLPHRLLSTWQNLPCPHVLSWISPSGSLFSSAPELEQRVCTKGCQYTLTGLVRATVSLGEIVDFLVYTLHWTVDLMKVGSLPRLHLQYPEQYLTQRRVSDYLMYVCMGGLMGEWTNGAHTTETDMQSCNWYKYPRPLADVCPSPYFY